MKNYFSIEIFDIERILNYKYCANEQKIIE
jgi:hypothetical protein